jgi:predicted RNA-binding protein YlxR (DUF448 family)
MSQPLRQCVVCKGFAPKTNLIRLAKLKDSNQILWDKDRQGWGRGIYICTNKTCLKAFLEEKKFKKVIGVHLEEACKTGINAFLQEGDGNG